MILGITVIISNYRWIMGGGIWTWPFELGGEPHPLSQNELVSLYAFGIIGILIIPISKIITGGGLLFLRKWSYRSTVLVVLVDFLMKFCSAITYSIILISLGLVWIPQGVDVMRISMLPKYIVALFDLLVISILTREAIWRYFERGRV